MKCPGYPDLVFEYTTQFLEHIHRQRLSQPRKYLIEAQLHKQGAFLDFCGKKQQHLLVTNIILKEEY